MRSTSRRRVQIAALLGGIVILVFLALETRLGWPGLLTSSGCSTALCCADCPSVRVTRIIDGDTFDTPTGRVRLYGVDTPERDQRCYQQATNYLRRLAGLSVRVESGERATDPNGRLLYYVYTNQGESIDEKLVREGLARAWTRDGQHRDMLVDLEATARRSQTGCLWQ